MQYSAALCCALVFAYLLNWTSNSRLSPQRVLAVIHGHVQSGEKFESPDRHIPSWGWTRPRSAFLFQLSYYKQALAHSGLSATFFAFLCFCLVISLLRMAPALCCVRVLSAGMSLWRKYEERKKEGWIPDPGMSYRAAGSEFNAMNQQRMT